MGKVLLGHWNLCCLVMHLLSGSMSWLLCLAQNSPLMQLHHAQVERRIVSQLLTLMDGLKSRAHVGACVTSMSGHCGWQLRLVHSGLVSGTHFASVLHGP